MNLFAFLLFARLFCFSFVFMNLGFDLARQTKLTVARFLAHVNCLQIALFRIVSLSQG